jgi:UDP-N-acetylglucosamine 2-epimerase
MRRLRPLLIFGTRPEAIKMAPVVEACHRRSDAVEPIVCLTGQHREMLTQVTEYFGLVGDVHLDVMTPNQTLAGLSARCLEALDEVLVRFTPDCVVAQGDTTTVMAAALAAFYRRVPLVHVEAGLRTGNLLAPWPEELNRRIADLVTALHCAPTQRAADALLAEGTPSKTVHVTGNTVIDALLKTAERERANTTCWEAKYSMLTDRPMVLITGHRRENFGQGFDDICRAIATLAQQFPTCQFVYPVHLNPNVQQPVRATLGNRPNVHLLPPAAYPEFVWLMDRSTLILTDSGGVQEEAPSLGKPVLVMRETTERPEVVELGAARLVGTSVGAIVDGVSTLLTDPAAYSACQIARSPYGDGHAAERIVELMLDQGWQEGGGRGA